MNKIITVADLMTILCDCVDSGTLDIDSNVILYTEFLDSYTITKTCTMMPLYDYNIISYMDKKAIRLTSVSK